MTRHLGLTFTDELAQAVADGRKTQTRRPLREPRWALSGTLTVEDGRAVAANGDGDWLDVPAHLPGSGIARVGDLLWVREAFSVRRECDDTVFTERLPKHPSPEWLAAHRVYLRAVTVTADGPWRPSIHMPKWACRTWARITAVYPERVADISNEDAVAEGFANARSFIFAWMLIYGDANGWCWVVKLERRDAPDLSGGER